MASLSVDVEGQAHGGDDGDRGEVSTSFAMPESPSSAIRDIVRAVSHASGDDSSADDSSWKLSESELSTVISRTGGDLVRQGRGESFVSEAEAESYSAVFATTCAFLDEVKLLHKNGVPHLTGKKPSKLQALRAYAKWHKNTKQEREYLCNAGIYCKAVAAEVKSMSKRLSRARKSLARMKTFERKTVGHWLRLHLSKRMIQPFQRNIDLQRKAVQLQIRYFTRAVGVMKETLRKYRAVNGKSVSNYLAEEAEQEKYRFPMPAPLSAADPACKEIVTILTTTKREIEAVSSVCSKLRPFLKQRSDAVRRRQMLGLLSRSAVIEDVTTALGRAAGGIAGDCDFQYEETHAAIFESIVADERTREGRLLTHFDRYARGLANDAQASLELHPVLVQAFCSYFLQIISAQYEVTTGEVAQHDTLAALVHKCVYTRVRETCERFIESPENLRKRADRWDKVLQSVSSLSLEFFEADVCFCKAPPESYRPCIVEFQNIFARATPADIGSDLLRFVRQLYQTCEEIKGAAIASVDEIFPIIVYVVAQSSAREIPKKLAYLGLFVEDKSGEIAYYLCSIIAAANFLGRHVEEYPQASASKSCEEQEPRVDRSTKQVVNVKSYTRKQKRSTIAALKRWLLSENMEDDAIQVMM